jgi:hypothetical protein
MDVLMSSPSCLRAASTPDPEVLLRDRSTSSVASVPTTCFAALQYWADQVEDTVVSVAGVVELPQLQRNAIRHVIASSGKRPEFRRMAKTLDRGSFCEPPRASARSGQVPWGRESLAVHIRDYERSSV